MVNQVRPRPYEVQADGKVYIRNRRHLRKYEASEDVEPAMEQPEVAQEAPITLSKEKSHREEREPQTENGASRPLMTNDNQKYRTRSEQISVKLARFNDHVMG